MRSLTVDCPAKINLYLRVLGRRPDGYHDLLTLFHRISLRDRMRLRRSRRFSLRCSDPRLAEPSNLVTKAYRLLQRSCPGIGGISVDLKKRIPLGAGLGGGSADAAGFLLAAVRLCGLRLPLRKLVAIGRELGADVPFFLYNVNQAVGKGRGDRVLPRPCKRRLWFTLVVSKRGLSTRKVYENLGRGAGKAVRSRASLTKENAAVKLICNFLDRKDTRAAAGFLRNDLEDPAFGFRPSLRGTIDYFRSQGIGSARMTGSGPTVFAVFGRPQEARRFARKLRQDRKLEAVVCHSF